MTNLQSLSQVAALSGLSKIMLVDRKTRQTGVDENFNKFNDDFSTRNDFYFDNKENESTNFASWLLPILDSTIYELDSSKWGAGIFPESPVIICYGKTDPSNFQYHGRKFVNFNTRTDAKTESDIISELGKKLSIENSQFTDPSEIENLVAVSTL